MSGLGGRILRAKAKLFGTAAQEIPVPFEVYCECGGRAAGIRRVSYQVADCSDCGRMLYVLPVNPYPATRRVPSEVAAGGLAGRAAAAVRELAGESSAGAGSGGGAGKRSAESVGERREAVSGSVKPGRRAAVSSPSGEPVPSSSAVPAAPAVPQVSQVAAQPVPQQAVQAVPVLQEVSLAVRLRRTFSPVRLLVTASLLLLCLTVWWMVQQRRQDVARRVWRQQQDAVQQALQAGDLSQLTASLERVVEAAGILGRRDTEALRAESLLRQCRAVNQLSQLDLVSSLQQLADGNRLTDERVTAEVRGLVFVFEAGLKSLADNGGVLELDLPLQAGVWRVRILTEAQSLRQLHSAAPQRPILFAAALRAGRSDQSAGSLQLLLDDSSVVVLTEAVTAGAAGYSAADASVAELLRQQEQSLGLSTAEVGVGGGVGGAGEAESEPGGAQR
ncbi:MAG: hypothetical protein ACKON9_21115 [Planctomycetaceae bacterium]